MRLSEKQAKLAVILFFTILALAGLVVSGDYGRPFDEAAEQVILKENLKEYAWQLLGSDSEAVQRYEAQGIQRISESIERDHGQCVYYPAAVLFSLEETAPDRLMILWHGYTWLWFMAGVLAIYGFGREMGWNRVVACLTSMLLYLAPRFFAEGHYNNKDVILLVLSLLTLWLGLRLLKKPGVGRGLLFSLVGAMAMNIKIVGIMPWGLMGLCILGRLTACGAWNKRMAFTALATFFSFLLFYGLLTPALWPDPVDYLAHVLENASGFTRWTGVLIYRGMRIDQMKAPIPRMYLPIMIWSTLPLYTLPLAVLGQLQIAWNVLCKWKKEKLAAFTQVQVWVSLALTVCWALPLGYAMVSRPVLYNGWRHFYFVFAGIVLVSGMGMDWASRWLVRGKRVITGLLCLCLATSVVGIVQNHPYQYVYYQELARGSAATEMELDYWMVSTGNAMKKLAELETRNHSLPLELGYRDVICQLGLEYNYPVLPEKIRERITLTEDELPPYLFSNTTYTLIFQEKPPEGYYELFSIQAYGNVICTVYEREETP